MPITHDTTYGNVSGRVDAIAVDPTNSNNLFLGTAGGGVWRSTDGGTTWAPKTDTQASLVISSLAIDATGQVIYAGTGDRDGDTLQGVGILKSTDAGNTWTRLAAATQLDGPQIASIAIDRTTSGATQRIFAATDSGLWISNDAGATWTKNTQINAVIVGVGAITDAMFQVVQDPAVASRYWATAGDVCRTEVGQVLLSNDSGTTWADSGAFPASTFPMAASRVQIGVGPSNTVYAVAAHCGPSPGCTTCNYGLYGIQRTTDGGVTWTTLTNPSPDYLTSSAGGQGWYDNYIAVDPTDATRAVFAGITLLATTNGGATFSDIGKVYTGGPVHPDQHAVTFLDHTSFLLGDDGGVFKTTDLGGTGSAGDWTNLNSTLVTSQFYGGSSLDLAHMLGGAQDNQTPGTFAGVPGNPTLPAWNSYGLGDGGFTAIDPTPGSNVIYFESANGYLAKSDRTNRAAHTLADPCDGNAATPACNDMVDFIAPFLMDPSNPQHLLFATNKVYQSTSGGLPSGTVGWPKSSPNLTISTQPNDAISAMTMTPGGSVIVTGSIAGAAYRSTDGGTTWTNVTGNLPSLGPTSPSFFQPWISSVAVNPTNPDEMWVALGLQGLGGVWHTTTGGATWADLRGSGSTSLSGNPAFSIVLDPLNPATLYLGTSAGAFVCSTCGGSSPAPAWMPLGTGLPNVAIKELTLTPDGSNLIAWTHGRGVYSLAIGSIPPLREALPAMANAAYGGYTTVTYVSNEGSAPAHVVIHYMDTSGSAVGIGDNIAALPPHASWTVRQDNGDSFAPGGAGSALIFSDQPISAFVNEFAPGGTDATSYTAIQSGSGTGSTIYAPAIANAAYGGYTTGIGLVNMGATTTTVTITYRDPSGAITKTQSFGMAASAYAALYSGDATLALPSGFAGTATITSTSGNLAAVVNETGPGNQFSSYDAVPGGSTTLFAPAALRNAYGGYNTGTAIQNTTGTAGTVTMTYYNGAGTPSVTTHAIAANGYLGIYQGGDIPADGPYTAKITSDVAIAAIVNEVAHSTNPSAQQSTSYNTFAAGAPTADLALVTNAGSDGWSTGEGIMNTGASATTVTVSYYDAASGLQVGTPDVLLLQPNAFWGLYQPAGGLPTGDRASAVVTTSGGGLVAVICNESNASSFMSYGGQ